MLYTVIRFLWDGVKFGTCTFVSVNWTLVESKMCTFTFETKHFIFNKCPIYTHAGASAKFSTNSHETDYSVVVFFYSGPLKKQMYETHCHQLIERRRPRYRIFVRYIICPLSDAWGEEEGSRVSRDVIWAPLHTPPHPLTFLATYVKQKSMKLASQVRVQDNHLKFCKIGDEFP